MSEEKKYFICRNGECQKDSEGIDGGMVFQYEITENENAFVCPNCKSKYIEIDNTIFYYAVIDNEEITFDGKKLLQNIEINEETVIASSNDFSKLTNQFESNRIYFPRLVLKNIDEPDFQGKKIAFNNCLINELIIEDVNITSAYYPILFSGCVINKIRISNSKVRKTNLNNYKSLWSFFGISFFNTTIFDDFKIEKSETRLMISNCGIKCPVQFSKSSKIELALIDNQDNLEIKEDEDSNVTQLLETIGKSPSASKKKISINGTAIQNISIDELHIDPDIKTSTVVENCSVYNLIFELV